MVDMSIFDMSIFDMSILYLMCFMAIGMAMVLLTILLLILQQGVIEVSEPRKPILITEILLMIALMSVGVYVVT